MLQICLCTMSLCGDLVMLYGPLQQIWLYAMAIAADMVMCNGPLRGMKPYDSVLWPIVRDLVMRYGLYCSSGFGYAMWAVSHDLVVRYGTLCKNNYHSAELHFSFLKEAFHILSRASDAKKFTFIYKQY
jgi:hypothetical protein